MGFSLNPVTVIKNEILKYKDKSGRPIALDALDKVESGIKVLITFLKKFTAEDVKEIINMLPSRIKAKLPPAEIEQVADAVVNLPLVLQTLETKLEEAEVELSK